MVYVFMSASELIKKKCTFAKTIHVGKKKYLPDQSYLQSTESVSEWRIYICQHRNKNIIILGIHINMPILVFN